MVNVIVLFPKTEVARSIRNLLVRSGFEVTAVCATGAQVVQRMEGVEEGLVVCGYKCSDIQRVKRIPLRRDKDAVDCFSPIFR